MCSGGRRRGGAGVQGIFSPGDQPRRRGCSPTSVPSFLRCRQSPGSSFWLGHSPRMGSGCRSKLASFYYSSATETPQPSLGPPWTSTIHGSDTCFPLKTGLWKIQIWVTERNHYTSNKACDKYKILPKHCLAPFCPYLCKSAQSRAPL